MGNLIDTLPDKSGRFSGHHGGLRHRSPKALPEPERRLTPSRGGVERRLSLKRSASVQDAVMLLPTGTTCCGTQRNIIELARCKSPTNQFSPRGEESARQTGHSSP